MNRDGLAMILMGLGATVLMFGVFLALVRIAVTLAYGALLPIALAGAVLMAVGWLIRRFG